MRCSVVMGSLFALGLSGCYGGLPEDDMAETNADATSTDGPTTTTTDPTTTTSTTASTTATSDPSTGDPPTTSGDGDGDGDDPSTTDDPSTGDPPTTSGDGDGDDPTTTDDPSTGDPPTTSGDGDGDDPLPMGCTAEGAEIVELINVYRMENNQPAIPLSPSLCIVAQTHVIDLFENSPNQGNCNLHSWSEQGPWSGCCYTPDHAAAACMWGKPGELTDYPGNGYENAAGGGGGITANQAVELWKGSPGHNDVMLNNGQWGNFPWGAAGGGLYQGYAVVWFGVEADPAG